MKTLFTVGLFILFSIVSSAQNFILTFEDTSVINQVYYTDSILDPQGIWQIGSPHKSFMTSALTQPNGVVTLIDSLLPPGSMGSFIITLPNVQLAQDNGGILSFAHRFQFDTAHGGGYVEFSVDSGTHWHGIFSDSVRITCDNLPWWNSSYDTVDGQIIPIPRWWDNVHKDTTATGILYFTGTDSTWIIDTIVFPVFLFEKTSQLTQYMFRFTVYTDTLSPVLGGWLIDNINYSETDIFCGGGINEINSSLLKIYPQPVTDAFSISVIDADIHDYSISIRDLSGRALLYKECDEPEATMSRNRLAAGIYILQITDRVTNNTLQKKIVFE